MATFIARVLAFAAALLLSVALCTYIEPLSWASPKVCPGTAHEVAQFSIARGVLEVTLSRPGNTPGGSWDFWLISNDFGMCGCQVVHRTLSLPLWGVAVLAAIFPLYFRTKSQIMTHRWKRRQLCLQCGYDLRGSDTERCPECGSEGGQPLRRCAAPPAQRVAYGVLLGVCLFVAALAIPHPLSTTDSYSERPTLRGAPLAFVECSTNPDSPTSWEMKYYTAAALDLGFWVTVGLALAWHRNTKRERVRKPPVRQR
jgi:hypothetical protein